MSAGRERGVYQALAEDTGTPKNELHAERELYVATDFFSRRPELRLALPTKCAKNRPDIELIGVLKVGIEVTELYAEGDLHWSDVLWNIDMFERVVNRAVVEKTKKFDWGDQYDQNWLLLHTSEKLLIPQVPSWIDDIRISLHPFDRVFLNYMPHPSSDDVGAYEIGVRP